MTKKELVKRYLIFTLGLFISSMGVAMITKANLGTSPISSIPYVMSLGFSLTLGQFTIVFSLFLILLQVLILGKRFKKESLLQIPVSVVFGYFIDWCMLLIEKIDPQMYISQIAVLVLGCIILALGVYGEVLADVVMLPGESFVRAVTIRFNTDFGITKVAFDVSMTLAAAGISFLLFRGLSGVREGTIIAAAAVGFITKIFAKLLNPVLSRPVSE